MGLFDFFKRKKNNTENNDVLPFNMFECDICGRKLGVNCRHHANVCSSCATTSSTNAKFTCGKCGKKLPVSQRSHSNICFVCAATKEKDAQVQSHQANNNKTVISTTTQSNEMVLPKANLQQIIAEMKDFLISKNYDIELSSKKLTIVKHSDDPWNRFNKFISKPDGIYNYVEVQMGGYAEKKRVSCTDFETACFLALALYVSKQNQSENEVLISKMKAYSKQIVSNSVDYWKGQFIIDELISIAK